MDAILEAAAQVFEARGYAAGTTNRIAERAGVSIGTLYQYFPNKDSVLVALVERHLEDGRAEVEACLAEARRSPVDLATLLQRFVAVMLSVHERNPDLHRVLFEEAPHPHALHECVLRTEGTLAHDLEQVLRECPEVAVRDADTAAHLAVQLVEGLTHRFALHGIHDLERAAFLDEVTGLVHGYLCGAMT